jgi:6-phospho-3-hexuloisomerase
MQGMGSIEHASAVIAELDRTLSAISPQEAERLAKLILGATRVFVAGAGRSGLAMKAFAMRLMHMDLTAYVVGETVTPSLKADDALVIGSGSGATASLVAMAEKAKTLGANIALVTIFPDSRIGRLADATVRIPASTPKADGGKGQFASVQPMGSLFEQTLLIFLDIVVMRLMERKAIDASTMFERHANLE